MENVPLCLTASTAMLTKTDQFLWRLVVNEDVIMMSARQILIAVLALAVLGCFFPYSSSEDTDHLLHADLIDDSQFYLHWQAPFLSGSGYGSEAFSYVAALDKLLPDRLSISHHGDSFNMPFVRGLSLSDRNLLGKLLQRHPVGSRAIEICHSEPGAWHPALYETSQCPSVPNAFTIGRTMFETDRIPSGWSDRLNKMDQIWVPTQWQRDIFIQNGVDESRVVVIPESVDVETFDPEKVESMRLEGRPSDETFAFLSMFKFEKRKGWDLLLEAYFSEFTKQDDVMLYIVTSAYHESDEEQSPRRRVERFKRDFAERSNRQVEDLPRVFLMDRHIPQTQLPSLYRAVNSFVLPSRGEGWGRPHSEAMAMALPTIATNWSGNTHFMTEENSYLIPIEGLEEVGEGAFASHLWAKPSVQKLQEIMRLVFTDREAAVEKGKRGRETMLEYSPDKVATIVVNQLNSIIKSRDSFK